MNISRKLGFVLIIVVISAAFLGGLYAHLNNSGWFETWKPLGKPPEKAIKISFYEENLPFVSTKDKTIYIYICSNSLSVNQKTCWSKTDFSELEIEESYPCYKVDPFDIPKPPGKVIARVEFESCPGRGLMFSTPRQHNFVLLEDGSVWAWEYSHQVPAFAFFSVFIHTLAGTALGAILAVAIGAITIYRNSHKVDTA